MSIAPVFITAGNLRQSITIQSPSSTRDAAGQTVDTWNTVLTTRASIENSGSRSYRESFSSNAFSSQSTNLITMRYPGASIVIEPGQRVILGTNTYLIQAVDNLNHRNRVLRLACLSIDGNSN